MSFNGFREFLRLQSAGGILLIVAALLAIICDNSSYAPYYDTFIRLPITISAGDAGISKPLLLWVNDGLMAIFFLLVGLELKREVLEGQLSSRAQIFFPSLAAIGGIIGPALIFLWFNQDNTDALRGWAIPTATDIAFALGILGLLGSRVPLSLKLFLTALAIMDDLGAIIIIAIFYTADLSLLSLLLASACLIGLFLLNRLGVTRLSAYGVIGILLWIFVLKSGVHATLAGVAIAMAIPLKARNADGRSPLRYLEENLHPWIAYGVLPLFAFVNAGVPLDNLSFATLSQPLPAGIAMGLFLGKQIGVFGIAWLAIRLGLAQLPEGSNWGSFYGTCMLAGVGFTMSLFIGSLAFETNSEMTAVRLGVLTGSLLSGLVGFLAVKLSLDNLPYLAKS